MKHFTRLSAQLRLATLGPLLLITCLFGYFYTDEALKTKKHQRIHAAKTYIQQLIPTLQFSMQHENKKILQELLLSATRHPHLKNLSIFDSQRQLISYYGSPIQFPSSLPQHPPLLFFKTIHKITYAPIFSPENNTAPLGWIALKLDTHPEQITLYHHLLVAIIIGLTGLIVALLIQVLLTQNILLPLARLRRSMKQILKNEFETEIKTSSHGLLKDIEQGCLHLQKHYLDATHDLTYHIETATADLQQSLELLEEKNIELSFEKKKIEERIHQQSAFIANMSHEIRTPMNGIMGFSNILLDSSLTPLQRNYANTIKNSTQDLLNIINDMLDYSKMEAGKLPLESIPINLRYLLDEIIALATPLIHQKQLDIFTSIPVDIPNVVVGDLLRIKQIFNNLLMNAIKFTEKGYILIGISVLQNYPSHYDFCFKITDTGIGISQEEQAHLFNAFYQTNASISRRYGGTGLGLAICKKLTEAMSGRIAVESHPQKGTTFSFYLPLKKLPAYEQEKATAKAQTNTDVLYVDAHPLSTKTYQQILEFLHYTPINITELLDIADTFTHHPQIKILIINLPLSPTPFDFSQLPAMPCLFLTNHGATTPLPTHAVTIEKPIQIQKLEEALSTLLNPTIAYKPPETQLATLRQTLKHLSPTLLIAEDNAVNRLLFHALLSPLCSLDMFQNGEEALEACLNKQYDIVLLDLQMPKRTGQEVAHFLRQKVPTYRHTPILFISANASDINAATLSALQVKKCLQKPIDEEALIREMLAILPNQAPPIDWERCLRNLSGNHKLALSCLVQFETELKQNQPLIQEAFKQKNRETLANLAHTIKGACAFLAIPRLKMAMDTLEKAALDTAFSKLKLILESCFDEIDILLNYLPQKIVELKLATQEA